MSSKFSSFSLNRNQAQAPAPSESTGQAETKIQIDTYLTQLPSGGTTPIIYNGDRLWARVTLTLETAGPVAVGQSSKLAPVLSGKGQVLQPGVPTTFNVAKGNKLYVVANGLNRITRVVEAYPWLETLTGLLTGVLSMARGGAAATLSSLIKR